MNKGFLYILIDPSLPKPLCKLGKATTQPRRADPANPPTDMPYVAYDIEVSDVSRAEAVLNNQLREFEDERHKGFFRLPLERAIHQVQEVAREVDKISHFQKAIEVDPDNASFHNNLGCSYDKLGNHSDAINAYKRAIELDPNNAVYLDNLGCNYGKLKLYRKAIDAFQRAIDIQPDFVKAHFDLGFSHSQLENYDKAVEAFRQAVRVNPGVAQIHYNLGHALNKLGQHKEAIRAFQEAVRVNPNYATAHYALGLKFLDAGDRNAAMKQYKILETLEKEKARDLFQRIYQRWGKKE